MRTHRKLYISSHGPKEEPIKKGFSWLLNTAVREGNSYTYLVAPTLRNLDGVVADALGADLVKRLKREGEIPVDCKGADLNLVLLTDHSDRYLPDEGPALVVYPNARLLDEIDDLDGATHMLVLPWQMEQIEEWIETWQAQELGKAPSETRERKFSEPVVEEALRSLTIRVNLSTGLGHPNDRDSAIWVFRKLKQAQIKYNPIEIKGWLVRHGWSSSDANDVKEVAEKIQDGTGLRTTSKGESWVKNVVDIWRKEAAKR